MSAPGFINVAIPIPIRYLRPKSLIRIGLSLTVSSNFSFCVIFITKQYGSYRAKRCLWIPFDVDNLQWLESWILWIVWSHFICDFLDLINCWRNTDSNLSFSWACVVEWWYQADSWKKITRDFSFYVRTKDNQTEWVDLKIYSNIRSIKLPFEISLRCKLVNLNLEVYMREKGREQVYALFPNSTNDQFHLYKIFPLYESM